MRRHTFALPFIAVLAACNTVPDAPETRVAVDVPEMRTCIPSAELTRVVIPAVTQTFFTVTEIDNAPYEPIQRRERVERVVEEEKVVFENSLGERVTNICDIRVGPDGAVVDVDALPPALTPG